MANKKEDAALASNKPRKKVKRSIKYPVKKEINLLRFELERSHSMDVLVIILFLLLLVAFGKFAVYDQLMALQAAQRQYQAAQDQLLTIKRSNARYNEVKKEYDKVTDYFLTDAEKAVIDKMDVLDMLEDDLMPYVELKTIAVNGTTVSVQTGQTTLDVVSKFLLKLQKDKRNRTATVTTASAAGATDKKQNVVASVIIDFIGPRAEEEGTESGAEAPDEPAAAADASAGVNSPAGSGTEADSTPAVEAATGTTPAGQGSGNAVDIVDVGTADNGNTVGAVDVGTPANGSEQGAAAENKAPAAAAAAAAGGVVNAGGNGAAAADQDGGNA